ncbi:helix-turn-helix domain-containing protein [Helicobacter labacensis]|nr:hypothetical protein [Helicobacter labacensis]
MKVILRPFDATEFLDSEQVRLGYLSAVLEGGNMAEFKDALKVM